MKLHDLKIGDKIKHYQCGNLINAWVIETGINFVKTKHEIIQNGTDKYETTIISKSTPLQMSISQTTPGSFTLDGNRITI